MFKRSRNWREYKLVTCHDCNYKGTQLANISHSSPGLNPKLMWFPWHVRYSKLSIYTNFTCIFTWIFSPDNSFVRQEIILLILQIRKLKAFKTSLSNLSLLEVSTSGNTIYHFFTISLNLCGYFWLLAPISIYSCISGSSKKTVSQRQELHLYFFHIYWDLRSSRNAEWMKKQRKDTNMLIQVDRWVWLMVDGAHTGDIQQKSSSNKVYTYVGP